MDIPLNSGESSTIEHKEAKLANLYEEYYGKIANYAYAKTGDRAGAQDIAGEVFLKALKSLKSYKEQGIPMQAWLFKIARNLIVDHYRKAARGRTVPIDNVILADNSNPADEIEKRDDFARVSKVMEQLTDGQREVLELRFLSELTSKEVGIIMGKSDGAVREMQRVAIEKLRDLLGVES
jgi:RNA polymerase sigma-70 factor (ECF subfamily)